MSVIEEIMMLAGLRIPEWVQVLYKEIQLNYFQ